MSKLSVAKLEKRYKARTVVHDVSLDVASGEVVGLLGPNGAGKTTCFYMIVGLVARGRRPDRARRTNLSRLPIHLRARLGLSYLPQEASIFRKLTVAENVRAILELQDLDVRTRSPTASTRCSTICRSRISPTPGVVAFGRRAPPRGDRARARDPAALHPARRAVRRASTRSRSLDIQKIIGFLKQRGIGVLITDHNVRETLGICDRAYIINEGRVLASGAPGEIVYNEAVRKVYLGEHFRL